MTLYEFYYSATGWATQEAGQHYAIESDGTKTPVPMTGKWVLEAITWEDAVKEGLWTVEKGLIQSGRYLSGGGSLMWGGPTGVKIGELIYSLAGFDLVNVYGFSGGYHITFNAVASGIPGDPYLYN